MLDAARPEARARVRSHPKKLTWGIVDAILALVMLPFGLWMFVIEGLVNAATRLLSGDTVHSFAKH
jgi:hypothetical protein